ncbi:RraA family protein [Tistrella bauzanensis]|uniref:Putative 4-hydroxy-4-methyl-2-oxoglutarate aldolase n=1 Tax=Tistrella arctica TaxID=3133430 RepID=A0ABU9YHH3_9PROT
MTDQTPPVTPAETTATAPLDDASVLAVLSRASTAAVSDVLDMLGYDNGLLGIRPLQAGHRVCGPAYTVRFEPVAAGEPAPAADYIEDVPAGHVVLLANDGRTWCTVWGDILSAIAKTRGIAGTVIDGACRDATEIMAIGYPLFSLTAYMKSGKNRVKMTGAQVPVTAGGARVEPGDWLVGDDSGVVVVPAARRAEVAALVQEVEAMEARVIADVRAGIPLAEARRRQGYNRFALKVEAPR